MQGYELIPAVQHIVAVFFLVAGAIYDVRERAVPEWLPASFAAVEALLLGVRLVLAPVPRLAAVYVLVDLLVLGVMALLVYSCLLGPGDLLMAIGVVLSEPFGYKLLPLPLLAILYQAVFMVALSLYYLASNLADPRARRELAKLPLHKRVARLFTARFVDTSIVARGSWWIPLDLPGSREAVCRSDVTPSDIVSALRNAPRYVWATYGIPGLVFLAAGYILALVLGDTPVLRILAVLLPLRRVKP